jgi:tRNA pseudouridine38-40 synthase
LTRNLKLILEYDGTAFAGWQRQVASTRTVQQVVEEAITRMTGTFSCLRGAGRTDAGVHARGQTANFRTEADIPVLGMRRGLNADLPRDVAVVSLEEAHPAFDARRWARGKRYAYRLWNRESRSPLHERTAWHIHAPLDTAAMAAGAAHLEGEHDFSAFRAAGCDRKNPVRVIRRLAVLRPEPDLVVLEIEATAFLRHMVRVIAGTLVEVGLGRRPPDEVATVLAGKNRARAGRTAPAGGLTLEEVFYDPSGPPEREGGDTEDEE